VLGEASCELWAGAATMIAAATVAPQTNPIRLILRVSAAGPARSMAGRFR
jgi:hypothetical protein